MPELLTYTPSSVYDLLSVLEKHPLISPVVPADKVLISPMKKKKTLPEIRQIYFNRKTGYTTIVWADGSDATVVHCGDGETFEDYMGFCAAIVKKLFGSTTAAKKMMDAKDCEKVKERKEAERQKLAAERRAEEDANRAKKAKREQEFFERLMKQVDNYVAKSDVFSKILSEEDDGK